MKFAVTNGQRQEAQPDLSGECPTCGCPVVAKCGEVRIWHWAHQGSRACDPWWENETEWHRTWKGQFPVSWQEVVHQADNGEKHVADVKTSQGWVLEFQHSFIDPEERRSRNSFYRKLVWIVDATRRKRDEKRFTEALSNGAQVVANLPIKRVRSDECSLLREWAGSHAPIFFDFGNEQALSWLITGSPDGQAYVGPVSRMNFIEMHRGGGAQTSRNFDELVKDFTELVADYETHLRVQALQGASLHALRGFQQYQAWNRRRRRF